MSLNPSKKAVLVNLVDLSTPSFLWEVPFGSMVDMDLAVTLGVCAEIW